MGGGSSQTRSEPSFTKIPGALGPIQTEGDPGSGPGVPQFIPKPGRPKEFILNPEFRHRKDPTFEIDPFAARPFAEQAAGILERGAGLPGQFSGRESSVFQNPLQQALLNPQFGATTSSEQGLLDAISSQTQGASALRGLGPATQGALAQNLAPALIGLRQQRVGNLQSALGQDLGFGIQQRGQDLTARGQDIQSILAERGQTLEGLFELIGAVSPQVVGGQQSSSRSSDFRVR